MINLVKKRDHIINLLHICTRLEVAPDQKIVDKLAKGAVKSIEKLTYKQFSSFLESLINLGYTMTPEMSTVIIKELENRQRSLL